MSIHSRLDADKLTQSFLGQLRSFDRLTAGRRVLALVALGRLTPGEGPSINAWRTIRDLAVHYGSLEQVKAELFEVANAVEATQPELEETFSSTLVPEVLQAGGALPEHVALASSILEQGLAHVDLRRFGEWFDTALDAIAHGPATGEVTTPRAVANLMVRLAEADRGHKILDPCCGPGALLATVQREIPHTSLFGQEINSVAVAFARLRLFLLSARAEIVLGDSLRAPAVFDETSTFDRILCDPPMGMPINAPGSDLSLVRRFGIIAGKRIETLFLQHSLQSLKPDGRAVVLMPYSFLARRGEAKLREELIKTGSLEGILALPSGVTPWTELGYAVLILRGNALAEPEDQITFVDAEYLKRPGTRSADRLNSERVDELIHLYRKVDEPSKASRRPRSQILQDGFDLQPRNFIAAQEPQTSGFGQRWREAADAEATATEQAKRLDSLFAYFLP